MAEDVVRVKRHGAVLVVTINWPGERNAVNRAVSEQVASAMHSLDDDNSLAVGVLTGAGGTFCAGMDLLEVVAEAPDGALELPRRIAVTGLLPVATTKRILIESPQSTSEQMWAEQKRLIRPVFDSEDDREGARAFAESAHRIGRGAEPGRRCRVHDSARVQRGAEIRRSDRFPIGSVQRKEQGVRAQGVETNKGEVSAFGISNADKTFIAALLRGMVNDLRQVVIPELTSGDAIERAAFAAEVASRLAGEVEFSGPESSAVLSSTLTLATEIETLLNAQDRSLAVVKPAASLPAARERLANAVRNLSEVENSGDFNSTTRTNYDRIWASVAAHEVVHLRRINSSAASHGVPAGQELQPLSADVLATMLKASIPAAESIEVDDVHVLAGGRSKTTVFAAAGGIDGWPREVVIREDTTSGVVDTRHGVSLVRDEYPFVEVAWKAGLPTPEPLLIGAPRDGRPGFMVTARVKGQAPGDWRGFADPDTEETRSAVRHLAEVLGQLHSLPTSLVPSRDGSDVAPEELMRREIEYRWEKWARDTVEPSPLIETALAHLRRECRRGLGGPSIVHGDVLPHNLLVADGRVAALLDWEFAHIGDPAEDLAYCRSAVSAVIPWDEFMSIYTAAGGHPIDERRLQLFGLYGLIRNCSFSASAARAHMTGAVNDFTMGAIGYFSIPLMESQIGAQLSEMNEMGSTATMQE